MQTSHTLAIGMMTGTSMDGIDAALIETDGYQFVKTWATASYPFSAAFQKTLRAAETTLQTTQGHLTDTTPLTDVIQQLTQHHATLVQHLLQQAKLPASAIAVIGFHGQNLYHHPEQGITLQIGDGQLLADLTGIPVIHRFRENDV